MQRFEVIVGKSLRDDGRGHSFAYVHTLEHEPAERMLAFLAQEGVGADQPVTFLSDGGDTVRRAQLDLGDCGERSYVQAGRRQTIRKISVSSPVQRRA